MWSRCVGRILCLFAAVTICQCQSMCVYNNSAAVCNNLNLDDIPKTIVANVYPQNIYKLDLSNNPIKTVRAGSFKQFSMLDELVLANAEISVLENGALDGLQQLTSLNLTNNRLTTINTQQLAVSTNLKILVVANNLLNSWDSFKFIQMPSLKYLDVSNNRLPYLPVDILKRLEIDPTFTISIANNPWDCKNDNWADILISKDFAQLFCNENVTSKIEDETTESSTIETTTMDTDEPPSRHHGRSGIEAICTTRHTKCNLFSLWIALGILGGMVLGNSDRIYYWIRSKCSKRVHTRRRQAEEIALKA